jgi:predicted TIM-barrel fold metal-dependent hydrolase
LRVIDAHTHTWSQQIISEQDLEARKIAAARDGVEPRLDSPITDLVAAMELGGIERAVVLPIDSGYSKKMPLTLKEKTDYHVEEVEPYPNIITFVGVDPRRGEEGLTELKRAVQQRGCRGWKMYPSNGFYPDDEDYYEYYRLCTDLGVPIIVHEGFTPRFKYVKYARPVYIDKVAADFPTLKIVIAHVGTPWTDEALMVAAKNPNVYVDISGWQLFALRARPKLYEMVATAKALGVFPYRMLWGSDFPLFEHIMSAGAWAEFFSSLRLPDHMLDSGYPQVNEGELERVMWTNAARLLFGE